MSAGIKFKIHDRTVYNTDAQRQVTEANLGILRAYDKLKPDRKIRVVLVSDVAADGLGDYANLIKVAQSVRQSVKNAEIFCLAVVPEKRWTQVEKMDAGANYPFTVKKICSPSNPPPKLKLDEKSKEQLRQADACIEIARQFTRWECLQQHLPKDTCRAALPEYGAGQLYRYREGQSPEVVRATATPDLAQHFYLTGAGPAAWYYLDDGLRKFGTEVRENGRTHALGTLSPPTQKALLDGRDWPSFLKDNKLYFSYLKFGKSPSIFASTALWVERKNQQDITLVSNKLDDLHTDLSDKTGFLQQAGVGRVVFVSANGVATKEIAVPGIQRGKTLRIVNPYPMNHEDFTRLMAGSEKLVGVTGNGSLTEALSLGQLPFFEKSNFWNKILGSFIAILKNDQTRENSKLISFYQELCGLSKQFNIKDAMAIAELLEDKSLWDSHERFIARLWEEHNFNDWVPAVIQRCFAHNRGDRETLSRMEKEVLQATGASQREELLGKLRQHLGA